MDLVEMRAGRPARRSFLRAAVAGTLLGLLVGCAQIREYTTYGGCGTCEPDPCANPCPKPCATPLVAPCTPPCASPCPTPCAPPCPTPCAGRPPAAPPPGAPADARPGEAWCRVWIPAVYETVYEDVLAQCAGTRRVWVPPVNETKTCEVCVKPPCAREVRIPPVMRTESYCCVVEPARVERRAISCGCPDPCAPKEGCCFEMVTIPAKTAIRTREICVAPGHTEVVYEPALYETRVEECVVKPGYWCEVPTPAIWEKRPRQVCSCEGRWEWRRNEHCEVPTPPCPPPPCVPPGAPVPVEPSPPPPPAPATPEAPPPAPPAPPPEAPKEPEKPPPPPDLAALQVEMTDKDLRGGEQGVFSLGEEFLYVLKIRNDESSGVTPALHAVFTLPPELEYVSATGERGVGVATAGAGPSGFAVRTGDFFLGRDQALTIQLRVRAKSVPEGGLTKLVASIRTTAGLELSSEVESSTLRATAPVPGGETR